MLRDGRLQQLAILGFTTDSRTALFLILPWYSVSSLSLNNYKYCVFNLRSPVLQLNGTDVMQLPAERWMNGPKLSAYMEPSWLLSAKYLF